MAGNTFHDLLLDMYVHNLSVLSSNTLIHYMYFSLFLISTQALMLFVVETLILLYCGWANSLARSLSPGPSGVGTSLAQREFQYLNFDIQILNFIAHSKFKFSNHFS